MARLPTLETCNQDDPKDAFQWAFVNLPFAGSTPLLVQPEVRPQWSQLFHDLGFRHHPELQVKKLRHPYRGQQHALNGSVQVVDMDDPDPDPVNIPDPLEYTQHEQQVMLERIEHGRRSGERAKPEGASVDREQFNPSDHTCSTVNGYLMACSPAEGRRVVAAEMVGKARDQILRKNKGL
jgi:hypothetical protein